MSDTRERKRRQFMFFRRLPMPPEGEWGGLEKLMFDWFERLRDTNCEVIVTVTTGWKDRFVKEAKDRSLSLVMEELPFNFFQIGPIRRFWKMSRFLKNYRPVGIVFFQAHHAEFGLPELMAAAWRAKGNIFMHENSGCQKPLQRLSRKHFGFIPGIGLWWFCQLFCVQGRAYVTKNILAVSREIKRRYVSFWMYPSDRVIVTHHGIDPGVFLPDPYVRMRLRHELKFSDQDKIFISMARLTPFKRPDRAIKAFDILFKDRSDIHLVLAGSGPLERNCRQLSQTLSCCRHIHFMGYVHNPADFLKMADIFVLSSDNEGLSIALLEAMACGLIAVSTDCAGSDEAIREGQTGFIVHKTDASLAEGMRKALDLSFEKRRQMSGQAVAYIREHFDIDCNVQKVFRTIGVYTHDTRPDIWSVLRRVPRSK